MYLAIIISVFSGIELLPKEKCCTSTTEKCCTLNKIPDIYIRIPISNQINNFLDADNYFFVREIFL